MKIKSLIIKKINKSIDAKKISAQEMLRDTIDSRNSDNKSSAGDKHETSRAKIQIEIDQLTKQLDLLNRQKLHLNSIDFSKNNEKATIGSLVKTNNGTYLISIGFGKVIIENEVFYAISSASPIGTLFNNKLKGDKFIFRTINYEIVEIC
tara:strand:+ start:314 stop:763 length:450 start_codon:yes stop_codon:yes gene_type:complete